MNQVKLATSEAIRVSGDLITVSFETNKGSLQLILASSEAISVSLVYQVMLSEVAHKRAKAKAYLSSDATSQTFFKGKPCFFIISLNWYVEHTLSFYLLL